MYRSSICFVEPFFSNMGACLHNQVHNDIFHSTQQVESVALKIRPGEKVWVQGLAKTNLRRIGYLANFLRFP